MSTEEPPVPDLADEPEPCWLCDGLRGIALHHHWTAQRGKPLWTAHTPASTQHPVYPCPACRPGDQEGTQ